MGLGGREQEDILRLPGVCSTGLGGTLSACRSFVPCFLQGVTGRGRVVCRELGVRGEGYSRGWRGHSRARDISRKGEGGI